MTGAEVTIQWEGRPARAWLPAPLAERSFELSVPAARATERAAAGVRRVGDRVPSSLEPLARLLLRAEGIASSNIEGIRVPTAQIAAVELDAATGSRDAALVAANLAVVGDALDHARDGRPLTTADLHLWHARLMRDSDLAGSLVG